MASKELAIGTKSPTLKGHHKATVSVTSPRKVTNGPNASVLPPICLPPNALVPHDTFWLFREYGLWTIVSFLYLAWTMALYECVHIHTNQ